MNEPVFALKGDICYSQSLTELITMEQGFLVCKEGKVEGVFEKLHTAPLNILKSNSTPFAARLRKPVPIPPIGIAICFVFSPEYIIFFKGYSSTLNQL